MITYKVHHCKSVAVVSVSAVPRVRHPRVPILLGLRSNFGGVSTNSTIPAPTARHVTILGRSTRWHSCEDCKVIEPTQYALKRVRFFSLSRFCIKQLSWLKNWGIASHWNTLRTPWQNWHSAMKCLAEKNKDVCSVYSTAEQFGHVVFKAFAVSRVSRSWATLYILVHFVVK